MILVFFWGLAIWLGWLIGRGKNRHGALWGLFLGFAGVIIVALLPARKPRPRLDR